MIPKGKEEHDNCIFLGCRSLRTLNASPEKKAELYAPCDAAAMFGKDHQRFTPELVREIFTHLANPVKNKKALLITEITLPRGIQEIGEQAFMACKSLKAVKRPSSLHEMENGVFMGCPTLESIRLPGKLKHSGKLFKYCSGLKDIVVAKSATVIQVSDFCIALTDVVIPEQVKEIRGWAFNGCSSLKNVYLHGGAQKIHKTAFLDCPNRTIHALAGSYAQQYAEKNSIPLAAE